MANNLRGGLPHLGIGGTSLAIIFSNDFALVTWFFNLFEERDLGNSPHPTLLLVVPVLLGFLQLKYQGKDRTSFEIHPISTYVAIASYLAYCYAYDAKRSLRAGQLPPLMKNIAHFCTWFFGYICLASSASLLFSNWITFLPYLLYFTLAIVELACGMYLRMEQRREWHFQEGVMLVQHFFTRIWKHIVKFGKRQPSLTMGGDEEATQDLS